MLKNTLFILRLSMMAVLCATLVGCTIPIPYATNIESANAANWSEGRLRTVVQHDHYLGPIASFESHDKLTYQEWTLLTLQTNAWAQKHLLLKVKQGGDQSFGLINGSELLVHRNGGQISLFDPKTSKDVSKPFPGSCLFNRSGTACLAYADGKPVILDTLSARAGNPKILARPQWADVPRLIRVTSPTPVLTSDAECIVLFGRSGFVEAWSINGNKERWAIPLERRGDRFLDADVMDGKIIILSQHRMPNGAEDEIRLINMKGETLHSEVIPTSSDVYWDSSRHEVLIACGYDKSQFELWNYESNSTSDIFFLHIFGPKNRGR